MDSEFSGGTPSTKATPYRKATISDLNLCYKHAAAFYNRTDWADVIPLEDNALLKTLVHYILSDTSLVLVSEDSLFIGTLMPFPFNQAHFFGQEVIWVGKQGRAMLLDFEEWCKEKNLKVIVMSGFVTEREPALRRLYKTYGYKPMETTYLKEVD